LPGIALLGTGGTIAASAADATQVHDYRVSEPVEAILAAVPQVRALARLHCEQICNVDSHDIGNALLLTIARRVEAVLAQPDIDGVVLTHGTDTLEETAYFLNLVLKSVKPVVLVGAMRPATALSADGPLNLLNAVRLATCAEAAGKGVLVMMNDRIGAARLVTKAHTTGVEAFGSAEQGHLGMIAGGKVHFFTAPVHEHTLATPFALTGLDDLPVVDILYDHQGARPELHRAAIEAGARGLVLAATGNGGLSPAARVGVEMARRHGVPFVRATRVAQGVVTAQAEDEALGTIAANSLNPPKARVLLMLALGLTRDVDQIRRWFERY
jgi:L-asparaginase